MSQTNFERISSGVEGQQANLNPTDKITLPAGEDLTFGKLVSRVSGEAKLGTDAPCGVTVRSLANAMSRSNEVIIAAHAGRGVTVMRSGYIFVKTISAVVQGETCLVTSAGEFTGVATSDTTEIAGLVFEDDAIAGAVVVVRVSL